MQVMSETGVAAYGQWDWRCGEGLRGDAIGYAGAHATCDVPVNLAEVPVEGFREILRRVQGAQASWHAFLVRRCCRDGGGCALELFQAVVTYGVLGVGGRPA